MALLYFDYDIANSVRMLLLFPVEMRLKVKTGINNCSLIDDSYSSDFQSLKIALISWKSKAIPKKTVILSIYFKVACPMRNYIPKFRNWLFPITLAELSALRNHSEFKDKFVNCITFNNTARIYLNFDKLSFANETILIKGAWSLVWRIVYLLEEKTHETVLKFLNGISYNLNF
jgi:alanine racemase